MRTISAPLRALERPVGVGSKPLTVDLVLMWEMSAATPGKGQYGSFCESLDLNDGMSICMKLFFVALHIGEM
jgi:hypothetical protein